MSGTADGSPREPSKPIDYIRPARRRGQQNTDDSSLISIDFVDGENSPLTGPAEPMTPVSTRPSPSAWLPEQAHTGRTMGSSPQLVGQLAHPGTAAGLPRAVIPLRRLGVLTKLAEGTQGVVSRTEQLRLNRTDLAVLKRYKAAVLTELDTPALTALVEFLFALPRAEGRSLLDSAAWPIRAVSDGDRTIGFVMPEVPDRYWIELSLPSGHRRRVPGQVQHLLNDDDFSARRGLVVPDRTRLQLLLSLAYRLDFLHARGVTVGDLSPKNLLFATSPRPRCYFVDCDAMALHGRSALPQLETPGWHVRALSPEPLATTATDRYKLALLVLRMLARDQATYRTEALPAWLAYRLKPMIDKGIGPDPQQRPTATEWIAPLRQAVRIASSKSPAYRPG